MTIDPAEIDRLREAATGVEWLVHRARQAKFGPIGIDTRNDYVTTGDSLTPVDAALIVYLVNHVQDIARELRAVDRVRALHVKEWCDDGPVGGYVCAECGWPVETLPCPTIMALEGPEC